MEQETIKKIRYVVILALYIGVYWLLVTTIYLVASFISKAWDITWITFPCAALLFIFVALIYFNKKSGKKFSIVNWIIITVLICVAIYLLVSFLTQLWSLTWIIFLVMTTAILLEIILFLQKKATAETEK